MLIAGCSAPTTETALPASYIVPENRLEELLVDSSRDRSRRTAFSQEFLRATVYLRVDEASAQAAIEGRLTQVRFFKVLTDEGVLAMALYTSERRLVEAAGQQPFIPMTGRQALILGKDLPISLNYGLLPSATWDPEASKALLDTD